MNISQVGIDLIKKFEGLRLTAYKPVPTEIHFTIGYGHYGPDVKQGQTITKQQAESMLVNDLKRYVDGVNKYVKVKLNQNQFDALVSFTYNCGVGALQTSRLLQLVNQSDFIGAANEFARWNKAGGNVLAGLTRRREEEKQLFLKAETKEIVTDDKIIKLTPNQEKAKQKLVDYGLMGKDYDVKSSEMVAIITMFKSLLDTLEKQGALKPLK